MGLTFGLTLAKPLKKGDQIFLRHGPMNLSMNFRQDPSHRLAGMHNDNSLKEKLEIALAS